MSIVQKCDGSLFQTAGAEVQKLRGPYHLVLVLCLAVTCRIKPDMCIDVCYVMPNVTEVGRTCGTDAVERHHSNFVVDVLSNRQPVQCVAKYRCNVVTQPNSRDEPRSSSSSPVWGGAPLFLPLSIYFLIFSPFLLFSFLHWLYLFSSFVHPVPLYQNSPTPFPGWRS